jgi:putative ABC transport system permease protein
MAPLMSHPADVYLDKEDPWVLNMESLINKYPDELKDSDIKDKKELTLGYLSQFEHGKDMYEDYLKLIEDKLSENGMEAKVFNDILYTYSFTFNGEDYNYNFYQVAGDRYGDYCITEGSAPQNKNEILITKSVSESFGINIGDTIEIDFDGNK